MPEILRIEYACAPLDIRKGDKIAIMLDTENSVIEGTLIIESVKPYGPPTQNNLVNPPQQPI